VLLKFWNIWIGALGTHFFSKNLIIVAKAVNYYLQVLTMDGMEGILCFMNISCTNKELRWSYAYLKLEYTKVMKGIN